MFSLLQFDKMYWKNILIFWAILLDISSPEFNSYNDIKMIQAIQFTNYTSKEKDRTSIIDCLVFCLDSEGQTLKADFCGNHCRCFSQTNDLTDYVANSTCIGIFLEFNNCNEIFLLFGLGNGLYTISIEAIAQDVYCDMDNGGWTVIQQRFDGSVNFSRSFKEYQDGFGSINGEYWLGLDKIHDILSKNHYKVRFDLEDFDGQTRFAEYSSFYVSNSSNNYKLEISGYSGNAGDSMKNHNGSYFSAGSVDNDFSPSHCANHFGGGWWYKSCHEVNINGIYNNTDYGKGLTWYQWRGVYYSLKSTSIKIKPKQ